MPVVQAGEKAYRFDIGDFAFDLPPNVLDIAVARIKADKKQKGYGSSLGNMDLRSALAQEISETRGVEYTAEDVAILPGAKLAIPFFIQSLMNEGDGVLYPNPGFPIYESQIDYWGGRRLPYPYIPGDNGFEIDLEAMVEGAKSADLLIYNNIQNPMGSYSSVEEIEQIAQIARHPKEGSTKTLKTLADEAYFGMQYNDEKPVSIVSMPGMADDTFILHSFSKSYAMTGLRLGAFIGKNRETIEHVGKLANNYYSMPSQIVQHIGLAALKRGREFTAEVVGVLKERRDILVDGINEIRGIQCYSPEAGPYAFPDVTEAMRGTGFKTLEEFRKAIFEETRISFTTQEHFGDTLPGEERKYIRLAFAAIEKEDIEIAVDLLNKFIEKHWIE